MVIESTISPRPAVDTFKHCTSGKIGWKLEWLQGLRDHGERKSRASRLGFAFVFWRMRVKGLKEEDDCKTMSCLVGFLPS